MKPLGAYEYTVKFWYQDPETKFWKPSKEVVYFDDKWSHYHAEKFVTQKWKRDFNQDIKIVNVSCD